MFSDELQELGGERMDEQAIRGFLSSQKTGVLGLPTQGEPYQIPISYGYDGERSIYFTYLVSPTSHKVKLTEQTDTASFLVYSVESKFMWESVILTGEIEAVPKEEWDEIDDILSDTWNPDILEKAQLSGDIAVYTLRIDEQSGIRHTGLPPGIEMRTDE